jgi:hypothetical protein
MACTSGAMAASSPGSSAWMAWMTEAALAVVPAVAVMASSIASALCAVWIRVCMTCERVRGGSLQ